MPHFLYLNTVTEVKGTKVKFHGIKFVCNQTFSDVQNMES